MGVGGVPGRARWRSTRPIAVAGLAAALCALLVGTLLAPGVSGQSLPAGGVTQVSWSGETIYVVGDASANALRIFESKEGEAGEYARREFEFLLDEETAPQYVYGSGWRDGVERNDALEFPMGCFVTPGAEPGTRVRCSGVTKENVKSIEVYLNEGDDSVRVKTQKAVKLFLGAGNDTAEGSAYFLSLGPGDDYVNMSDFCCGAPRGGPGNDLLIGRSQQDRLFGGPGDDTLFGKESADVLNGGPGRDRCFGGSNWKRADRAVSCEVEKGIP